MRALGCATYHELHRVSIEEPERFWPALIDDLGLEFSQPWERVLDTSNGPEWATWFVGGRLNVAWNCVHKWKDQPGEAAVFRSEDGMRAALTWPQLSREVTEVAGAIGEVRVSGGERLANIIRMRPR